MALRGRREPPSQSDGLGGPSYRFPQIVTALSIVGHDDRIVADPLVAVKSAEEVFRQVVGVPAGDGFSRPVAELVDHCLGD